MQDVGKWGGIRLQHVKRRLLLGRIRCSLLKKTRRVFVKRFGVGADSRSFPVSHPDRIAKLEDLCFRQLEVFLYGFPAKKIRSHVFLLMPDALPFRALRRALRR